MLRRTLLQTSLLFPVCKLTSAQEPEWKKTCDVLVIGAGGAGLVAAVRAAELGAKVILIERKFYFLYISTLLN